MFKNDNVRVIQIAPPMDPIYNKNIYGLGDDSNLYVWNWAQGKWELYKKEESPD